MIVAIGVGTWEFVRALETRGLRAPLLPLLTGGTIMLALAGIVVGVLFSLAARVGIVHRLPLLRVIVTGGWILKATIIAIIGAIFGALYPAYKAAQKDPIDALAYE